MADTLLGFLAEKGTEIGAKFAAKLPLASTPGSLAVSLVDLVLKVVDSQHEKAVCKKAQEALGCKHIVVCPHRTGNPRSVDMIDYIKTTRGMAFVYESVALGHPSSDLDVKKLSTQVYRHEFVGGKSSFTDSYRGGVMSCGHCMRDKVGGMTPGRVTGNGVSSPTGSR
jgi:hypothetical protein